MNCVILQPSYIPWRGYFHQIQKADTFIFYDDVQYDVDGWRNRNKIKTPNGTEWLTIPVITKGVHSQNIPIKDIQFVPDVRWREKHLRALRQHYGRAPFFQRYWPTIEAAYAPSDEHFADFICNFTVRLARELGIQHTKFLRSSNLPSQGSKTDRLISILVPLGVKHYISGPAAQDYIEHEKFAAAGITVEFIKYGYPEYPQLYGPFEPQVSILDLLFNVGPDASKYIWDRP